MIQRFGTPRPITAREQRLIELYVYCPLAMTPEQFYGKWDVKQEAIALICFRSVSMVRRWFARGRSHYHPHPNDLRHLALMDFLLEHFEEIPPELWQQLCSTRPQE
ncbi:MAG: helix-turn-helix domain-containing protein [Limnoraphis robusta]|jgi:hypothetical protein